jgi:hypothetical protein
MLAACELMKVAHVEAVVAVAIERQQLLDLGDGGALRRGRLASPIEQALIAVTLEFSRIRRMLRGLYPRMSAAWSQVSLPARARTMTSWTFMARSTALRG